jgi:hypothetical protein
MKMGKLLPASCRMIDRRRLVHLALAAMLAPVASATLTSPTQAQQAFQRFLPLLVELPGWQGAKPDGLAMEVSNSRMISATREYERGEAKLSAQILIGAAAEGAVAAAGSGVKIETSEARMSTSTIDGLQVSRTYMVNDKSGAVIVALGRSAVFMLSFDGITDEEGLTLAKRFNWKTIQAEVAK